jgi:hypothetical protein
MNDPFAYSIEAFRQPLGMGLYLIKSQIQYKNPFVMA